ncbi:YL1 nuclear protein C-terminal domain-domain-containing protein [Absidia repens]|uniref:YL1 nuclear protein C-terminal domain-domain-containing protein n=1 Tax=Absidia repens TaxID=90262 RepID=A0A1X2IK38_9FUNG|nr:YL1 nuclear protein C-terminal domain-domain-containing protein [Absidia repens]
MVIYRAPKRTKKVAIPKSPNVEDSSDTVVNVLNLTMANKSFKSTKYTTPKKWKNLKQILTMEKAQEYNLNVPTYQNIECPPSIRPQKKYCDITGLSAKYTDPKSGLRYHNTEIYQFIRTLGVPSIQAYLGSRNAAVVLK